MKVINLNKNIFAGIVVLILISVVFGYFLAHREVKRVANPIENKRSDSAKHFSSESIPTGMGLKPEINEKDGSVKIVKEFIKLRANNPASLEFLEWSVVSTEGGYWKVRCKYKGVSSFNAEVTTNAWFYIWNNKVVYSKIISKI